MTKHTTYTYAFNLIQNVRSTFALGTATRELYPPLLDLDSPCSATAVGRLSCLRLRASRGSSSEISVFFFFFSRILEIFLNLKKELFSTTKRAKTHTLQRPKPDDREREREREKGEHD